MTMFSWTTKTAKRTAAPAILVLAASLALTGCGGSTNAAATSGAGATSTASAELRAMLPAKIRDAGTLNVAISLAYPPMEYSDAGSTELKGADIDMAKEVASRLGLKPNFQNVDFSQLIVSVTTGRSDLIWTAFSDLAKRQGQLDFVDYFRTGNQFFAPVQNQKDIKALADLCGRTVAVSTGTSWVASTEELSKSTCPAENPIKILQIPTQAEEILQMQQDRAQASLIGFEGILDLQKQQPNKFYTIGDLLEPGNYGIAVAKESTQLRDTIKTTLEAMKADGTYGKILDQYGLKAAGLQTITVNDGK
ncbi:ABC transporter substrate-binding protein [Arthrobacter sp. B2a2-09]|uniref:ABC transporter substrate-binding protein n=1 Tax=Arthrobacter sp. B2a2-09 TaxID=2952822 RepID=UPI0022CD92A9|nr:ABC transporter substrate-binding protein [Arthrobacter sp. B2a2-09]MCZ9880705.1 ABC transporter substrate-binding protein [Arthrobacter sp. B2a2-09]